MSICLVTVGRYFFSPIFVGILAGNNERAHFHLSQLILQSTYQASTHCSVARRLHAVPHVPLAQLLVLWNTHMRP